MEMKLEQVLKLPEPVYLVFPALQVCQTPCFHLFVDHMTVPRNLPGQEMVWQQQLGKQPGLDTAEPACNQRTFDSAGKQEECRAPAFVPYKDTAGLARTLLVVGTHRKLEPQLVVLLQEARK